MSADVEVIRARADAASPLPWKSGWYKVTLKYRLLDEHTAVGGANDVLLASCGKIDDPQSEADAAFIAAARTDVPLLCDALIAARARVAALEAEREGLRDAGRSVVLAFHDWPEHASTFADNERVGALASLVGALTTEPHA